LKSLGKCPICGNDVIENKNAFTCSNWNLSCNFIIWKNDKYLETMRKKPTRRIVRELLKNGKVRIKDLRSKKGTMFDAYFKYIKKGDYFSWKMMLKNK
jgi:DNA topoisomerase-3